MNRQYTNRLRADELRHEVGVRGTLAPEGATVNELRQLLTNLLREEEEGTEHDDALLPIDVDEESNILDAKVQEIGASVELLALEADDSAAGRVRALAGHCNRRLSRLLANVEADRRNEVKSLLRDLKGHVRDLRSVSDRPPYQASSVFSVSTLQSSQSSSKSSHSSSTENSSHSNHSSRKSSPPKGDGAGPRKTSSGDPKFNFPFHKWDVKFSGEGETSVLSFIMDVEEKAESQGIEVRYLIKGAPEFFTGRAKTWYRSIKKQVDSWDELKLFLRTEFLPLGYLDNLWEEVRARKQGETESIGAYIANMLMLFDRLAEMGPVNEEMKLNIIVKNLAPFYMKGLAMTPILSIGSLKKLGRELEMARFRVERYEQARTPKSQLMEPEFAFQSKGRSRATVNTVDTGGPEVAATSTRPPFNCWRCGQPNHAFRDCKEKGDFEKFCWGCGKKGVVSQSCTECKRRREARAQAAQGEQGQKEGSWGSKNPW